MPRKLRKCEKCGAYNLTAVCRVCGGPTRVAHPPKFSPLDKYARYRRAYKFSSRKE